MTSRIRQFPLIAIRKLVQGDEEYVKTLNGIAQIASSIFPESFSFEDITKELLSHKDSGVYVARDIRNSQLAGFDIWYHDTKDNQAWLWLHGVPPQYQRKGLGKKIMRYCLTDLELLGYNQVTLKIYNGFPSMIRLCRRMGFVRIKKNTADNWGEKNNCSYYYQKQIIPSHEEGQLRIEDIVSKVSDINQNPSSKV